jgi:hypothetical protein
MENGIKDPYGWISVSDRMPETNSRVLVFIPEEDHHITTGMWDVSRKWVLLDEYRIPQSEVTYWMPMIMGPLDTSYTPCKYVEHSPDELLRSAQKENFDLKTGIRKFVHHWESYFNNKIVGNPPVIQDLKNLLK